MELLYSTLCHPTNPKHYLKARGANVEISGGPRAQQPWASARALNQYHKRSYAWAQIILL